MNRLLRVLNSVDGLEAGRAQRKSPKCKQKEARGVNCVCFREMNCNRLPTSAFVTGTAPETRCRQQRSRDTALKRVIGLQKARTRILSDVGGIRAVNVSGRGDESEEFLIKF